MTIIDSTPRAVRAAAKEYVRTYFANWGSRARTKLQFAWERGFWASHNNHVAQLERIALALDAWEAGRIDVDGLVNEIDAALDGEDGER